MKIDGTNDRREPIRVVELRGELMTDSITPTQEIEMWIRQHGSERDALNVAIARIRRGEVEAYERGRLAGRDEIIKFVEVWECPDYREGWREIDLAAELIVKDIRNLEVRTP